MIMAKGFLPIFWESHNMLGRNFGKENPVFFYFINSIVKDRVILNTCIYYSIRVALINYYATRVKII